MSCTSILLRRPKPPDYEVLRSQSHYFKFYFLLLSLSEVIWRNMWKEMHRDFTDNRATNVIVASDHRVFNIGSDFRSSSTPAAFSNHLRQTHFKLCRNMRTSKGFKAFLPPPLFQKTLIRFSKCFRSINQHLNCNRYSEWC